MDMIDKIRSDEKEDVRNQISDHVDFDNLLTFVNENRKQIEEIKVVDEENEVPTKKEPEVTEIEETTDKSEDDFSQQNPNSSVGIWSLFSTREIIEDVINSSEDEVDEEVSNE